MSRSKLRKFAEIEAFPNVVRGFDGVPSGWYSSYFQNDNPITLEIGCGKGEYTVGLAREYPERNFIGIDRKGERLWKGAGIALEEGLANVMFLHCNIVTIAECFEKDAISEIWLPFPDPYPKRGDENRRLTSGKYLGIYKKILKSDGLIHLKTDDKTLYDFTLESVDNCAGTVLEQLPEIRSQNDNVFELSIMTTFEQRHIVDGKSIRYIKFRI